MTFKEWILTHEASEFMMQYATNRFGGKPLDSSVCRALLADLIYGYNTRRRAYRAKSDVSKYLVKSRAIDPGIDERIAAKSAASKERRAVALTLRQQGLSHADIGKHFNVSGARARQLVEDGKRNLLHQQAMMAKQPTSKNP